MAVEEVEKTAVWVPRYFNSPIAIARQEKRRYESGSETHRTTYEIILFDERKGRGLLNELTVEEALSLAAFILLTADADSMSDDYRMRLRRAAREILSEAERMVWVNIPKDAYEGW